MKTHVHFTARDLDRSAAFYEALLQSPPAKALDGYALFVTEDPALELALSKGSAGAVSSGVHFGLAVESVADVERAAARLREHGYETAVEREETCCYANQTKVWASDPDGRRWEVYAVHRETDERDALEANGCCEAC